MSIFLPCMLIVVVNSPSPHDVVLVHGDRHHVHVVIPEKSRGYIVCIELCFFYWHSCRGHQQWLSSSARFGPAGGPALCMHCFHELRASACGFS